MSEDFEAIIRSRLNKIEDIEERRLLKDFLAKDFTGILDYSQQWQQQLEDRVYQEIALDKGKLTIYTAVCHKDKFNASNGFLFPVLSQELNKTNPSLAIANSQNDLNEPVFLFSIFLECDAVTIKKLLEQDETYPASLITDKASYQVKIKLCPNGRYVKAIERLYHIFQFNNVNWHTINNPYEHKFLDVMLLEAPPLDPTESITQISFDLGPYEKYQKTDLLLLWNVRPVTVRNKHFPEFLEDTSLYEHSVLFNELGLEHGYLADVNNADLHAVNHFADRLALTSPNETVRSWNLWQICQLMPEQLAWLAYPPATNRQEQSFITNYAAKQALIIRTQGEIHRIINAFEAAKDFTFREVKIQETLDLSRQTYDMNPFIIDEIRQEEHKKIMLFKFQAKQPATFSSIDRLSFLISELQLNYPEYLCVGELV